MSDARTGPPTPLTTSTWYPPNTRFHMWRRKRRLNPKVRRYKNSNNNKSIHCNFWGGGILVTEGSRGGSSRCVLIIKVKVGCKWPWGDIGDIRTNKRILSFCSNQFRFRVKCQLDLCYIMNTYDWSWFYNLHNKIQTWWFISILRPPRHNHHCLFINF